MAKNILSLSDAPSWLKIDGDDFSPNEFADTIILIFKLAVKGLSSVDIAAELNSSNLATSTGCAWSGQNVCKVIRNDQVLGHKKWKDDGSISESYYPRIVDVETIKTARELVEGRRSNPAKGRTTRKNGELGPCNNLFRGLRIASAVHPWSKPLLTVGNTWILSAAHKRKRELVL